MDQIDPRNAHQSPLGPVFDVATWSPRKVIAIGAFGLVLGLFLALLAVYVWQPHWVGDPAPQWLARLNNEVADLKNSHPAETWGAVALAGLVAVVFTLGGLSCLLALLDRGYYFRVGPGGISLRLPRDPIWNRVGLGSRLLCLDVPWDDIAAWNLVQIQQSGSRSAEAGHGPAYLKLKTAVGQRHRVSLDAFREPAQSIAAKIEEARQLTLAQLGDATSAIRKTGLRSAEEKFREISSSLSKILWKPGADAVVALVDDASDKSVHVSGGGGSLVLTLPQESVSDDEKRRAADLFARLANQAEDNAAPSGSGSAAVATEQALEVVAGDDVQRATQLALELFSEVYQLPDNFPLVVQER